MKLFDKVITSTTTASSGIIVKKSYTKVSLGGKDRVLKEKTCIFPEGHHMRKTYRLSSLTVTTQPKSKFYSASIKGNVLGRELESIVERAKSTEELKGLLKTLKRLQNLPNLKNLSLVDDILKIAKFIK